MTRETKKLNSKLVINCFMVTRRRALLLLVLTLLFFSAVSLFYLFEADFYVNSNLFWIGSAAGFLVPVFLISAGIVLFSSLAKKGSTKKLGSLFSAVTVLALVAVLIYKGPGSLDSDVWWHGAIAGFLGSLSLTLFILAVYAAYKLIKSS
jgi:hypothetical protein